MKDFVEFSPTEKLMFDLGNLTCFDAIGAVRKLPRIDQLEKERIKDRENFYNKRIVELGVKPKQPFSPLSNS